MSIGVTQFKNKCRNNPKAVACTTTRTAKCQETVILKTTVVAVETLINQKEANMERVERATLLTNKEIQLTDLISVSSLKTTNICLHTLTSWKQLNRILKIWAKFEDDLFYAFCTNVFILLSYHSIFIKSKTLLMLFHFKSVLWSFGEINW